MAQLIFLGVLLGGSWLLYRKFISDAQKLTAKSRAAEKAREEQSIDTLVEDPETGEYRPRRNSDDQAG